MTRPIIRSATGVDVATAVALWREFKAQEREPAWRRDAADSDLCELERAIGTDIVLLAEQDGQPAGLALTEARGNQVGYLHILYVRPCARRSGIASALIRETVNRLRLDGRRMLELDVLAANAERARGLRALGFLAGRAHPRRPARGAGRAARITRVTVTDRALERRRRRL